MTSTPEVRIVDVEYAAVAHAAALNHRIARNRPLLRASLDIRWEALDAPETLRSVETTLLAFSPSFRRHECRGPAGYHVFVDRRRETGQVSSVMDEDTRPFDPRLALAHLIEHAVIDFESTITHERRISGLTGARREPPGRFDLLVECPEPAVGRLCLALAVWILTRTAGALRPGPRERDLLAAARLAYAHPGRVFTQSDVARSFDWPCDQAARALASLMEFGYLKPVPSSMNFSGLEHYAVASA